MFEVTNTPIEYNVANRNSRYPFKVMEVGQSFIIPADRAPKFRSAQQITYRAGAMLNRAFRAVLLPNGDIQIGRIS